MNAPSLAPSVSHEPHVPVRTCVGCRRREPRSALVRLVLRDNQVMVDEAGTAPGRGAWLHPTGTCLDLAVTRKAVGRALRAPQADVSALVLRMSDLR